MTTSRRKGKPVAAEPAADRETVPKGAVADDEQELRQEIERTREQLGETVEQLAAKTDVKARGRAKTADLAGQVKATAARARATAADCGAGVRGQVAGMTVSARQKAAAARGTAKAHLQAGGAPVWEAAPEPLQRTATKATSFAKQRRVPLVAAAAALIAGYLAFRGWRRR